MHDHRKPPLTRIASPRLRLLPRRAAGRELPMWRSFLGARPANQPLPTSAGWATAQWRLRFRQRCSWPEGIAAVALRQRPRRRLFTGRKWRAPAPARGTQFGSLHRPRARFKNRPLPLESSCTGIDLPKQNFDTMGMSLLWNIPSRHIIYSFPIFIYN